MAIHATDAIVLRRYPYRETSVTVSCLSNQFGKLKGLIKGLRVQPNRHRSAMEPMTVNRIIFYDTAESQLHLISHCELLHPMAGLSRDMETFCVAAHCVEVAEAVAPLEEPQPEAYHLLQRTLDRLSAGWGEPMSLQIHFIARLLRLAGFQPQLDECTGCGIQGVAAGYWSARHGGLLCQRCLHHDLDAEPAPLQLLQTLGHLATAQDPESFEPLLAEQVRRYLDDFLGWRLAKPLKTLRLGIRPMAQHA